MMTAIVFNGTKIYMDTDMELHVIRGDLHIDTKSFKAVPKTKGSAKRTVSSSNKRGANMTDYSIIGTIRDSKLKIGKSIQIYGKRPTIYWAVKRLGLEAKITGVGDEYKMGNFTVTRTA